MVLLSFTAPMSPFAGKLAKTHCWPMLESGLACELNGSVRASNRKVATIHCQANAVGSEEFFNHHPDTSTWPYSRYPGQVPTGPNGRRRRTLCHNSPREQDAHIPTYAPRAQA